MKRALLILTLSMSILGVHAFAQEPKEGGKEPTKEAATEKAAEKLEQAEKQEQKDLIFKTVNFILLFGLIIYFLRKPASDFFTSRTAAIQQGMADAAAARDAAEKRLAEMEQRLTHLGDEIAGLRAAAAGEDEIQAKRMSEATDAEAAKIRAAAESEIDTMARAARLELKKYAAKLAVDLAESRLKTEMNPQSQAHLLDAYVKDLGGKN